MLARSSDILVRSLTNISRIFGLSEYVIAFVFMSVATSLPELFVGISSVVTDGESFSFGNIIGANFLNLTLVSGVAAVLAGGLQIESKISRKNFLFISFMVLLPVILATDGILSRIDGAVLLFVFALYIIAAFSEKNYFSRTLDDIKPKFFFDKSVFTQMALAASGLFLLVLGSFAILYASEYIAARFNMSSVLFGLVFISAGTVMPELAFGIRSVLLKHGSMSVGTSLGSVAFNSAFILGLVSLMKPVVLPINHQYYFMALFIVLALVCFNMFVFSKNILSRKEGFILLWLYVFFLAAQYFTGGF
jgi:cation:H+ antiporter